LTVVLYPGSFDPVTNGHLDIVSRAATLFDEVVIGIYETPQKKLLFSTEERVELAKKAVECLPNVRVESYSELTVEFARRINAKAIVRGLRMSSDFEREFEMAMMNKKLASDIEVVCLMAGIQYQFLSSSLIKEVVELGDCIDDLVPPHVAAALRKKLLPTTAIKR
jgi:pantetheine-phosphate adenylyltransferase